MTKDWTGNNNSIWKTLGASNHTDKERQSEDFYATSPDAIDKLLKVAHPRKQIWECAAAVNTGRNFIGIELNKEYFQIAQERIKKAEEHNGKDSLR